MLFKWNFAKKHFNLSPLPQANEPFQTTFFCRRLVNHLIVYIHYITAPNQLFLTPPCNDSPFIAPGGFPKKSRDVAPIVELILAIRMEQLFGNKRKVFGILIPKGTLLCLLCLGV